MDKIAIFDEVDSIVKHDSATKKDIFPNSSNQYRDMISNDMSDSDFEDVMHQYLANFGIISHLSFHHKKRKSYAISLRSYNAQLFIESSRYSSGLQVSDEIIAINGIDVMTYKKEHLAYFVSKTAERHFIDWSYLIAKAQKLTVKRNEKVFDFYLDELPKEVEALSSTDFYFLDDETLYIKLTNFYDEEAITKLYRDVNDDLHKVKHLVIDVRVNNGGSDSLYFPLLKYALPCGKEFSDIDTLNDEGMEILYTKTNVKHRLTQFEEQLDNPSLSEESRKFILEFKKDLLENQDKGFVVYENEESFLPGVVGLEKSPENIYILSDLRCGSSGDNFVEIMKSCPKVTVLGRPTLGILDYSNCATVDYGEFTFIYPTSRSLAIDSGKGMLDKGVVPDIEIEWTPEHLVKDIDMIKVMELINGEKEK